MALILDPSDGEFIDIGTARLITRHRNGRVRLVIEGLSLNDVVRVCGVDVMMTRQYSGAGKGHIRVSASGPRSIPIKKTGQLSDLDEDYQEP